MLSVLVGLMSCSLNLSESEQYLGSDASTSSAPISSSRRFAPPSSLLCNRNMLTPYEGSISALVINDKEAKVTIETQYSTVEDMVVMLNDATKFLLSGKPRSSMSEFNLKGLLIEDSPVIGWACLEDRSLDVLDFRPARY